MPTWIENIVGVRNTDSIDLPKPAVPTPFRPRVIVVDSRARDPAVTNQIVSAIADRAIATIDVVDSDIWRRVRDSRPDVLVVHYHACRQSPHLKNEEADEAAEAELLVELAGLYKINGNLKFIVYSRSFVGLDNPSNVCTVIRRIWAMKQDPQYKRYTADLDALADVIRLVEWPDFRTAEIRNLDQSAMIDSISDWPEVGEHGVSITFKPTSVELKGFCAAELHREPFVVMRFSKAPFTVHPRHDYRGSNEQLTDVRQFQSVESIAGPDWPAVRFDVSEMAPGKSLRVIAGGFTDAKDLRSGDEKSGLFPASGTGQTILELTAGEARWLSRAPGCGILKPIVVDFADGANVAVPAKVILEAEITRTSD